MRIERITEVETADIQIGDRIHVDHYTATCQEITTKSAIFLLDQYLDKPIAMNVDNTNRGGYAESDLRKALQSGEVLNIFADIRDYMVPLENGDLLRIPFAGEMFGAGLPRWAELDGHEQWPLMQDRRNRLASRCGCIEWGWFQNKDITSSTCFGYVNSNGFAYHRVASNVIGVRPVFQIAKKEKMKIHQLKILDVFADEIIAGNKMFEIRYNDRGYHTGDYICFTVISDESGKETKHAINTRLYEITCVLGGSGLMDGFVALGIREANTHRLA